MIAARHVEIDTSVDTSPPIVSAWSRRTNGGIHLSVGHDVENPEPIAAFASMNPTSSNSRKSGCQYDELRSPISSVGPSALPPDVGGGREIAAPGVEVDHWCRHVHRNDRDVAVGSGDGDVEAVVERVDRFVDRRGHRLHTAMPVAPRPGRSSRSHSCRRARWPRTCWCGGVNSLNTITSASTSASASSTSSTRVFSYQRLSDATRSPLLSAATGGCGSGNVKRGRQHEEGGDHR